MLCDTRRRRRPFRAVVVDDRSARARRPDVARARAPYRDERVEHAHLRVRPCTTRPGRTARSRPCSPIRRRHIRPRVPHRPSADWARLGQRRGLDGLGRPRGRSSVAQLAKVATSVASASADVTASPRAIEIRLICPHSGVALDHQALSLDAGLRPLPARVRVTRVAARSAVGGMDLQIDLAAVGRIAVAVGEARNAFERTEALAGRSPGCRPGAGSRSAGAAVDAIAEEIDASICRIP